MRRRVRHFWSISTDVVASLSRTSDFIADSALPIFESAQLDLIDDRHGFLPVHRYRTDTGDTPGQFLVRLSSRSGEAVLTADLTHTPFCSFATRSGADARSDPGPEDEASASR